MEPEHRITAGHLGANVEARQHADISYSIAGAVDNLVGKELGGKYEILSMLGSGGMSSVYLAKHKILNKVVCIKTIRQRGIPDANTLLRFRREAQACSTLNHPNIISVHDFGEAGGVPYFVMDYAPGISLEELIKSEGRLSADRVVHIFRQACAALQHAHEHGVVHRDIKPSNIMLMPGDTGDLVKVVDFGIAKLVSDEDSAGQKLTQTGEIFGTPFYMSPEQCQGLPLDARTDVYSLGCVIYETLSGKPPLVGANVFETISKHISEMPEGLHAVIRNKQLCEAFERIVFGAMAKEPERRYQSMQALATDLNWIEQRRRENFFQRLVAQWYLRQLKRGPLGKRVPFKVLALSLILVFIVFATVAVLVFDAMRPEPRDYYKETLWDGVKINFRRKTSTGTGNLARVVHQDLFQLMRHVKKQKSNPDALKRLNSSLSASDLLSMFLGEEIEIDTQDVEGIQIVQKMADKFWDAQLFEVAAICYEENLMVSKISLILNQIKQMKPIMKRDLERLMSIYVTTEQWGELAKEGRGVCYRLVKLTEGDPSSATNLDRLRLLYCRWGQSCYELAKAKREDHQDGSAEIRRSLECFDIAQQIELRDSKISTGLPELGKAMLLREEGDSGSESAAQSYAAACAILTPSLTQQPERLSIFLGNYGDFLWEQQHYVEAAEKKLRAAALRWKHKLEKLPQ